MEDAEPEHDASADEGEQREGDGAGFCLGCGHPVGGCHQQNAPEERGDVGDDREVILARCGQEGDDRAEPPAKRDAGDEEDDQAEGERQFCDFDIDVEDEGRVATGAFDEAVGGGDGDADRQDIAENI